MWTAVRLGFAKRLSGKRSSRLPSSPDGLLPLARADRGFAPSRCDVGRADEDGMIRYQKLGYVGINVTDIGRARAFYENIVGLQFIDTAPNGSVRYRCSDDCYNVVLHQSAQPGFRYVGLMLQDDDQYDALRTRLEARDISYEIMSKEECRERRFESGWRISEPHLKAAFEFYRPLPEDAGARFTSSVARIQRIGHVVLATPQYKETLAFLRDVLNFAESDDIEGVIAFFRLFPNPYHHGIGVGSAHRVEQRVSLLPRSGWHDPGIQLRHGGISRIQYPGPAHAAATSRINR